MNSKRVILFIDSLGTGGAQRQIVNLAIGLKKKNLRPLLVYYNDHNYFKDLLTSFNIDVIYLKRNNIFDYHFFINFFKLMKRENANWIIAFLFMPSFYALLLKILLPNLKIIVSERSFEQKTKLFEKIFPRSLYFLSKYITANSQTQTNILIKKYPRLFHKIIYIPNGVIDQELIYKNNFSNFNIVSIGRVSKLKETKLLIEAVAKLKKSFINHNIKVFWIGAKFDSNFEDDSYYQECVDLIQLHNLQLNWEWIGQISNVKNYLYKASILVHMSSGEGFPNAICESMSFGIPVIASNVMDHPNIIVNNFNGFLVESRDLDELLQSLKTFLDFNLEQRELLSKNAYFTAIDSFSLDKMVNSYYNLLNFSN